MGTEKREEIEIKQHAKLYYNMKPYARHRIIQWNSIQIMKKKTEKTRSKKIETIRRNLEIIQI